MCLRIFLLELTLLPIAPRCQVKQDFLNMRRKDRVEVVYRRHRTSNKRCATPTAHAPCPVALISEYCTVVLGSARHLNGVDMWRGWGVSRTPTRSPPHPPPLFPLALAQPTFVGFGQIIDGVGDAHDFVRRFGPSPTPVLLVRK